VMGLPTPTHRPDHAALPSPIRSLARPQSSGRPSSSNAARAAEQCAPIHAGLAKKQIRRILMQPSMAFCRRPSLAGWRRCATLRGRRDC
jgi:hypothetical protein